MGVGDLVGQVVSSAGLGAKSRGKREALAEAWREAVGRDWAGSTRVVSLQGGVLTVAVATSALAHELMVYYKHRLLECLRSRAGLPVTDLRCRVEGTAPAADEQAGRP